MNIQIAQRLKPFSHTPGVAVPIVGSSSIVRVYPSRLLFDSHQKVELPLTGPFKNFTVELNLEKNGIWVFGKAKEGYFRYVIQAHSTGFSIHVEKGPLKGEKIVQEINYKPFSHCERLSLGSHKAQDWDLVQRRQDLKEILPSLFLLGQKTPDIGEQKRLGTARLLDSLEKKEKIEESLLSFFQAGFFGLLAPRLFDDQFQGLSTEEKVSYSPFFLLQEGAKLIRSLFFVQNDRRLAFLPMLPPSFDAGRMTSVFVQGVGKVDFEWSKKLLKKVIINPDTSGDILLDLQSPIRSFRVNRKEVIQKGEPLFIKKNQRCVLDHFQK